MTQHEILELALIGAKANLHKVTTDYSTKIFFGTDSLRSALFVYDDIKEMIEKEESPDCSQQPRQKINVVVDNVLNPEAMPDLAEEYKGSAPVWGIILRIASFILSVAAILISILKG